MYVQVRSPEDVEAVTESVKQILEARHRPGANYHVENLTAILNAAKSIALILSLVLVLVSAIALAISGIGIMNIMLVTVTERTREIGLRMAVGASRREILIQFLTEAVLVSLAGGSIGILVGVSIPLSVQFFVNNVQVPISTVAIAIAFGVSMLVGLIFGILPANRAAKLNPTRRCAMNKVTGYRATMVGNPFRMRSVWAPCDEQIPLTRIGADRKSTRLNSSHLVI